MSGTQDPGSNDGGKSAPGLDEVDSGNVGHGAPGGRKSSLSEHARHEIDLWLTKFPPDRRRSAVLAALRAVQHDIGGYLTKEAMDAVAE